MATTTNIIARDAQLDPAIKALANLTARISRCPYDSCNNDDIPVLETCRKTTTEAYDRFLVCLRDAPGKRKSIKVFQSQE